MTMAKERNMNNSEDEKTMDSGVCHALQSTKSDLWSQVPRLWKVRLYSAVLL